ncbi:MAG: hypothetical protein ACTHJT_00870 [Cytophaga sp.]|uniref:hypothetical protein n=1 Tax=Cytophaga sp. TaxID=29535 RepID=UPI003F81E8F6
MKEYVIVFLCLFLFSSCFSNENNVNDSIELSALRKERDSLKNEIKKMNQGAADQDSAAAIKGTSSSQPEFKVLDTLTATQKPVIVKRKIIPVSDRMKRNSDTICYFYTDSKKVAVKIVPPKAYGEKKKIRFYDPQGRVTFEQEDILTSYSISTEFSEFHENGAAKRIVIHLNPGGSMHWYETVITFDADNNPLWKEEITYPLTLEGIMNNKSYWDKSNNQWVREERNREQPVQK